MTRNTDRCVQICAFACQQVYISHLFLGFEISKVSEEFSLRGELSRLQEMKKTEEFLHSVLQRSASQQHLVFLGETHRTQIRHRKRSNNREMGNNIHQQVKEGNFFFFLRGNGTEGMRGRTVFDPHYKVSALTKSNIFNQIACIFS